MEKYAKKLPIDNVSVKLNNLKKIINPIIIEGEINAAKFATDDETDALNIAYYSLKNMFSKIKRYRYGTVLNVDYKPKTIESVWYKDYQFQNSYYWTSAQTSYYTASNTVINWTSC